MTATPNALRLISMVRNEGATDYERPGIRATTDYMERLRLTGLTPITIERNRQTPNLWIEARHIHAFASRGLQCERYEARRGRHSGLAQIKEFVGAELVKVKVTDPLLAVEALRSLRHPQLA
jgi:hypothetical protein